MGYHFVLPVRKLLLLLPFIPPIARIPPLSLLLPTNFPLLPLPLFLYPLLSKPFTNFPNPSSVALSSLSLPLSPKSAKNIKEGDQLRAFPFFSKKERESLGGTRVARVVVGLCTIVPLPPLLFTFVVCVGIFIVGAVRLPCFPALLLFLQSPSPTISFFNRGERQKPILKFLCCFTPPSPLLLLLLCVHQSTLPNVSTLPLLLLLPHNHLPPFHFYLVGLGEEEEEEEERGGGFQLLLLLLLRTLTLRGDWQGV